MTKTCHHKWIQLTNQDLEERLLQKGLTTWNVRGCVRCGGVQKSIGDSGFSEIFLGHSLEGFDDSERIYYEALRRFVDG